MTFERTEAWWKAKAMAEEGIIAAGVPDIRRVTGDSFTEDESLANGMEIRAIGMSRVEETRLAFGRFINMMRRQRGLTIEAFAQDVQVDASELLVMEDDVHYVPTPRTVYRLALAFGVPQVRLLQLAGLAETKDASLRYEAVRFAASADPVKQLSREEKAALETFVAVLSRLDSMKRK